MMDSIDIRFSHLFKTSFGFNDEEYAIALSHFTRKALKKGDYYHRTGAICNTKAYVNKGCARTYVTNEAGKESILFFSFEDWWLCDFPSFNSGAPGTYNTEALEDCDLLEISRDGWNTLRKQVPKLELWYTVKAPKSATALLNRFSDEKMLSAEERYLALVKSKPFILQRVPLQYIAAYLNIEPQSLSRMRSRLAKNK